MCRKPKFPHYNTINETQLLPLYLDKIRNGYVFTEDILKKIEKFDDYSKMKIILEFNRIIVIFNEILNN
jgi:hypothetical protein